MDKIKLYDTLYYLASPYTSGDKWTQELRYMQVQKAAAYLITKDYCLLEPIAMCHAKAQIADLRGDYKFWQRRDRTFISRCDALIVVLIEGWDTSVGVTDEVEFARKLGKPIYLFNPEKGLPLVPYLNNSFGETNAIH